MNFFSIKWKFSIAFVLFTLSFLGVYVLLATRVFEYDKLSYVFETQQKQVEGVADSFSKNIERALLASRAIAVGYNPQTRRLQPTSERFFSEESIIDAIDMRLVATNKVLFKLEKNKGTFDEVGVLGLTDSKRKENLVVSHYKDDLFILSLMDFSEDQDAILTRVVVRMLGVLDETFNSQTLTLIHQNKVAMFSDQPLITNSEIDQFLKAQKDELPDGTSVHEIEHKSQLVSAARTSVAGFTILGFIAEDKAMSALHALYRRSVVFVLFSLFATVFVSMLISYGLTRNINSLTSAAQRLGQGDFSLVPESRTRDEVGILTKAFQRMITEIQRLLRDTADKARMESELKTARLVQESLFPEKQDAVIKNISLSGYYATSTECGGDWWYYYVRGNDVFIAVADATGHGTPAALVTSAARSLFSFVERSDLDLPEIATHWNEAIAVCSKQKVYMTALLARINTITGIGSYINAGHEPPILLEKDGEKYKGEFLITVQNATLGERTAQQWSIGQFEIKPGGRLLIFTDGLTAFQSPDGKALGEKRFLRAIERLSFEHSHLRGYVNAIFDYFYEFGGKQTLPDDVTFVAVENISSSNS